MNIKNSNKTILRTPGLTLFFNVLKRGLWMPAALSILNIVIISFSVTRYRFVDVNDYVDAYERLVSRLNNEMVLFVLAIIVSALVGCVVFSYLNRVSSACFIHGLPVSRTKIFFAHYCAGAAMLLIPAVVSSVYMGLRTASGLYGLLFLAVYALYSIGVFSFAVLVCQLSANTLGGIIFTGFGLATPVICEGFVAYLMETSLYGYAGYYGNFTVSQYFYIIPERIPTPLGLIYVFAAIGFTLLGLLLFRRRSIEYAGDLIAFAGIRKAAVYVCGILAGMCAYLIFDASLLMFLLFGVLCAVLVNFAVRKRFTIRGAVTPAVTVLITTLVIFAIFRFDLTGFEGRIPELDNIESARVFARYYDNGVSSVDGKTVRFVDFHKPITEPEDIEKVRELHKDLIGNRNFYSTGEESRRYTVEYTLKNGKKFERKYTVYYDRNAEAMEPVAALREFKRHNHELLEDDITVLGAEVQGVLGDTVSFDGVKAARLYEAVVKDLMAVPYELNHDFYSFSSNHYVTVNFEYFFNNAVYPDGSEVPASVLAKMGGYDGEAIYPSYVNTIAVIRDIAPELLDVDAEFDGEASATVDYYSERNEGTAVYTERYESVEITDREAVREIIKESLKLSEQRLPFGGDSIRYFVSFNINDRYFFDTRIYGENEVLRKYVLRENPEMAVDKWTSEYGPVPYVTAMEDAR